MTLIDLDARRYQEFLNRLSPHERGLYAEMVMRSLRGNWGSPRKRVRILEMIAETGSVEYYPADELQDRVDEYFTLIGRGDPDGRYWRSWYQETETDLSSLDRQLVEEMAHHIPDDVTWDDYKIDQLYD